MAGEHGVGGASGSQKHSSGVGVFCPPWFSVLIQRRAPVRGARELSRP